MRISPSRQWLDAFLGSSVPGAEDLRRLVAECPREDEHLDYKSGLILGGNDARRVLREYVSAFGNADGGTLVVGYNQATRTFDGAGAPGGGDLDEWAVRVINEQLPHFSPPPRIRATSVGGHDVLLLAIPRAPALVPLIESRRWSYYLRLGESNYAIPEYLLNDLLLGRRNRPFLRLELKGVDFVRQDRPTDSPYVGAHDVRFRFVIENSSLVFAEDVRVGLVAWSLAIAGLRTAPAALCASLELPSPPSVSVSTSWRPNWTPAHVRLEREMAARGSLDLGSFDVADERMRPFLLPVFPNLLDQAPQDANAETRAQMRGHVRIRAAVYALAKNCDPWWYQLVFEYDRDIRDMSVEAINGLARLEPLRDPRPVVAFEFLPAL